MVESMHRGSEVKKESKWNLANWMPIGSRAKGAVNHNLDNALERWREYRWRDTFGFEIKIISPDLTC